MATTNFVVAETHTTVLARAGSDTTLLILDHIERAVEFIERITADDELRARVILEQYSDATSFVVMERLGLTEAFTFDRHFAQFGFALLQPG